MRRGTAKIDLHGMLALDAECELRAFIDALPNHIHTVEVIHGIGGGVLKQMVADFYHSRISHKVPALGNPGQTNLYIVCPLDC